MKTEECENGIIKAFFLEFDEPSGQQGRNFVLRLKVETSGGGYCVIRMNPRKLPQLLEMLKVDEIHQIIDMPIIIEKTHVGGPVPKWIQYFLASFKDKPFPVNEGEYYGSNLYTEYPKKDIDDFLPKTLERPPLGEKPDFSNDIKYHLKPRDWIEFTEDFSKMCKTPDEKNSGKK